MEIDLNLEVFKDDDDKTKKEKNERGIEYIRENFVLKFITVDDNISENRILLLERACISYYNPKYNKN